MRLRLILMTVLSLPCLLLLGCGNAGSSATTHTSAEALSGPLSSDDVAKAEAEMDRVADEERAYQSQNPVGKPAGKKR